MSGSKRGKNPGPSTTTDSTKPDAAVSSSEDVQWWLPLSERLAATKGSASAQTTVQQPDPDPTAPAEASRRSTMGLALVAGLAAVVGAGVTSLFMSNLRSAPQDEPKMVSVVEVTEPKPQSPSHDDIPLSKSVAPSDGVTTRAPAVKSAEQPASAPRRARTEPRAAPAAKSTEMALASPSASPHVPPPPVQPETPAPIQAPAAPEPPASPRTPFFGSTDVTEVPQVASRVEPRLPDELVNSRVNDVVVVHLLVSQTGHPFRISLLRRSRLGAQMDDAVIAAVNRWTFLPARKNGEAVSCWLNVGVPIMSSGVEASTSPVAKLGEPHTADQSRHGSRARQ